MKKWRTKWSFRREQLSVQSYEDRRLVIWHKREEEHRKKLLVRSFPASHKDFILRARVLKLYRQALRTARRAPEGARAELNQTIRQEMENNRDCKDKQKLRFLISEGLERLKGLDEMLDMQGRKE